MGDEFFVEAHVDPLFLAERVVPIHRSAWNMISANFPIKAFCDLSPRKMQKSLI
jgi:hypothetical protein